MKIIIVIPAHNEARVIAGVINDVKEYVNQVVVVDDGSSDATVKVSQQAGAIVLTHLINRGQGAALRTGNEYALSQDADIIVHFDADGQHQSVDIEKLLQPILQGEVDVVLGSRFLDKKSTIPFIRQIILFLGRLFNRLVLGVKLTDPQSGLRALTSQAVRQIDIQQDKMAHCSEILEEIIAKDLRVKEVPIMVKYTTYSKHKGQSSLNALKIALRIVWGKINKV